MSTAGEDLPIDICISRPIDGGGREKRFFSKTSELAQTLIQWRSNGVGDVMLTWGTTTAEARNAVEAELYQTGVEYRCPQLAARPRTQARPSIYVARKGASGVLFSIAFVQVLFGGMAALMGRLLSFSQCQLLMADVLFVSGGICS